MGTEDPGPGDCPSPRELQEFGLGQLAETEHEAIARHLEASCPRCEATIERLDDREDCWIAALGAEPALSTADAEKAYQWALDSGRRADPAPPATTVEYLGPPNGAGAAGERDAPAGRPGGRVEVAPGRGPGGAGGDLRDHLQRRLLFAAALLAWLYSVSVFKGAIFFQGYRFGDFTASDWASSLIVHGTFLAEALAAVVLWHRKALSLRQLRVIELLVVSLPLANQLWVEVQSLFVDHQLRDLSGTAGTASGRHHVLVWVVLIIGYAVLVPNTWRRCYAVVASIAGVALALNVLAAAWDGVAWHPAVLHHLVEVGLWLGFAVAFAAYASYRIEEAITEGRRLGQYVLGERIGEGGMGCVYRASHAFLRRPCAVKLIRPEKAGDPANLVRFEKEVQAAALLTHPNTLVIFDYGRDVHGTFYYAMEYLPGPNLQRLVECHGPLPPGRAVFLLRQVCSALQEAHRRGLTHRDIKPGNVIVCERGGLYDVAKLLDFGLVKADALLPGGREVTREGTIVGSPAYMSPEQAAGRGGRVDARSDLYSVGATAYYLLTRRPPFVRRTLVQTLAAHLEATPDRAPLERAGVPADLVEVVLRCLEKDPARRPPSAGELEKALAGCACAGQWDSARAAEWWQESAAHDDSGPKRVCDSPRG